MLCQECNGKVSKNAKFCPECGAATAQTPRQEKNVKKAKRKRRRSRRRSQPSGSRNTGRDGYDGYYDNRKPADKGNVDMEGLDKSTWKKVAMIAGGALVIILACVALLLIL